MRILRDKFFDCMPEGQKATIKKVNEAEFLLQARAEVSNLLAEAVSTNSAEKFADLLEIINSCCNIVNIDWYEVTKIKSSKRWEEGSHEKRLVSCSFEATQVNSL